MTHLSQALISRITRRPLGGDKSTGNIFQMGSYRMAFAIDEGPGHAPSKFKKTESIEYKAIFAVTFAVFLAAEILGLLLPQRLAARFSGSAPKKSVIRSAKESASTCATYAFMG